MENPRCYPGPQHQQIPPEHDTPPSDPFASASFATGILAALTFFYFPLPIILASSSIILAILSRGESSMNRLAKAGIIISLAACIFSCFFTAALYGLGTSKEFYQIYQQSELKATQTNSE